MHDQAIASPKTPKEFSIRVLDDGTFLLSFTDHSSKEYKRVEYSYDNLEEIFEDIRNDLDSDDKPKKEKRPRNESAAKLTSMGEDDDE